MTDVETWLRTTFAADAEGAPDADLSALAGAVRWTVRRERRRRASVAGALGVLVAAAGLLVVPRLLPVTTSPAAQVEPVPSPASSSPADPAAGEPALRWRGVVVPVPASYLLPDAVRCGVPLADAAYVERPGAAVARCLATPEHPERLTTVVLSSSDPLWRGAPRRPPEQVLDDGRTRLTTRLTGAPVRITVTSPDAALARRLLDGARIEADLAGCDLEAVGAPPDVDPGAALLPGFVPLDGTVCSYTGGWVDSWRRLTRAEATDLMAAARTPLPGDERRAAYCAAVRYDPEGSAHWVVRLRGTTGPVVHLWVAAGPCVPSGIYSPDGGYLPLTRSFVDRIMTLAPGVGAVSDVVDGAKG